jgi:thioredoxin-related protein
MMKRSLLLAILLCTLIVETNAQTHDTVPPYKKDPTIPAFSILQTDSTWFNKEALPSNKPIIIIYFSPDCGHCQLTAKEYVEKMDSFKDAFFVWVSFLSLDEIKSFAEEYKLNRFKNVRVGRDPKYFVPSFYQVKFTPFIAVYSKKGQLMETYDGGTDPDTLIRLLHPAKS